MRIFCAVRHSLDPDFYYGALWSQNFYPALRALGHEILESEVDLLPASRFMHIGSKFTPQEVEVRAGITSRILDELKTAHAKRPIDLFLTYFYNSHFDPAGFEGVRRLGISSVNFYCNSMYQFDLVRAIAAKVDFAWHSERDARPLYIDARANPLWVQMGADPSIYHPVEANRQPNACFVGQRYADRDRKLAALILAKIPGVVYGPGWKSDGSTPPSTAHGGHFGREQPVAGTNRALGEAVKSNWRREGAIGGTIRSWSQFRYRSHSRRLTALFAPYAKGAIPFEQQKTVFSSSEVVLNFSNVWADGRPGSALIPHVRLRDFEAPMCRSCYLTGYTDELAEFYELGKEIDTYQDEGELVDKTKFYLKHPEAAAALR